MAKPNVISKDNLIHFAKECLVENGIEKFTLKSVADLAGVSQGTIYYHFKTKEQLLLDVVQDICKQAWTELSYQQNQSIIRQAIDAAKSRCSYDSFYHKLFFTLVVSSFTNVKIRDQLADITILENKVLTDNLQSLWNTSPIEGVTLQTWGIFLNGLVDGLALQALLQRDFPIEKTYQELEHLLIGLTKLLNREV